MSCERARVINLSHDIFSLVYVFELILWLDFLVLVQYVILFFACFASPQIFCVCVIALALFVIVVHLFVVVLALIRVCSCFESLFFSLCFCVLVLQLCLFCLLYYFLLLLFCVFAENLYPIKNYHCSWYRFSTTQ